MKRLIYLVISLLSLLFFQTASQSQDLSGLEKVYLHIDRTCYFPGDTIWFKAYSWYGYDQIPDTVSKILYVDLIDTGGRTIQKKKLLIRNGISKGDFCLDKNTEQDSYIIRAYTRMMLYNNTGDPFYKEITIIRSKKPDMHTINTDYQAIQDSIDVQFFPEGGNMVIGQESRIAFKATDKNGYGIDIKGLIKDKNGDTLTHFHGTHKGMGTFLLTPLLSAGFYYATIIYGEKEYKFSLPAALSNGTTMSVRYDQTKGKPYITIKYSHSQDSLKKYIIGTSNGKVRFAYSIETVKDSSRMWVPVELLPEGICRLTVLDANYKPECERLAYINKNSRFKIEVTPQNITYGPRSKVNLLIKSTDCRGVPLKSDLSVSVVDNSQVINEENSAGINSFRYLLSDLHGFIEDPGFYFMNTDTIRTGELDLLLLTHGYRKFLQESFNKDSKQMVQPEDDFEISGIIEEKGKKNSKKLNYNNINMNFVSWGGNEHIMSLNPDSLGKFTIHTPFFYSKASMFINATTDKGKPFKGEIKINEEKDSILFNMPHYLTLNKKRIPSLLDFQDSLSALEKKESRGTDYEHIKSTALNEIVIKSRDKFWFRRFESKATKIINMDATDPDGNKYDNLNDILVKEFGARRIFIPHEAIKTVRLPSGGMGPDDYFPVYVINGQKYFDASERKYDFMSRLTYLSLLSSKDIKKIMVIPFKADIVSYYANPQLHFDISQSMVVIETYDKGYRGNPEGGKKFILDGLDAPREFYSPRYEPDLKYNKTPDKRITLYWNPSVKTNSDGEACIEFFTNDTGRIFDVTIYGTVTKNGHTGQTTKSIRIN